MILKCHPKILKWHKWYPSDIKMVQLAVHCQCSGSQADKKQSVEGQLFPCNTNRGGGPSPSIRMRTMMIGWWWGWWSSSSSKDIIWNKLLFPCNTPSIGYHCEERMIMGMIMLATMIMLTSLTIMHGDQKVEHFSPATPSMDWISMDPPYLSVWGTKMRMQHQPIPPINPIIIRIRIMIGAGGILGF